MSFINAADWDNFLQSFPSPHLLQTSQWAELKTRHGWDARWVIHEDQNIKIGAQILFRQILPGIKFAYIAKGPVFLEHQYPFPPDWSRFWSQVDTVCRSNKAFFLKIEPDIWVKAEGLAENEIDSSPRQPYFSPIKEAESPPSFFLPSHQSIQPLRTLVIDIRCSDEQILSRMKQKTRYNIRLAIKKEVVIRSSNDLESFSRLMDITGNRDEFGTHDLRYYRDAYELFNPRTECELFIAEYQGQTLAAIMVFTCGNRAWYLYGASSDEKRELMPSYLLQWEAIRWAKKRGCLEYDLWGVPDADLVQLEKDFTHRKDGLWGVYRFKRGFGGELRRAAGPWDRVYNPLLYKLYQLRTRFSNPAIPKIPQ